MTRYNKSSQRRPSLRHLFVHRLKDSEIVYPAGQRRFDSIGELTDRKLFHDNVDISSHISVLFA